MDERGRVFVVRRAGDAGLAAETKQLLELIDDDQQVGAFAIRGRLLPDLDHSSASQAQCRFGDVRRRERTGGCGVTPPRQARPRLAPNLRHGPHEPLPTPLTRPYRTST